MAGSVSGIATSRATPPAPGRCASGATGSTRPSTASPGIHKPVLIYWLMRAGSPWAATTRSAPGWSRPSPGRRPACWPGGWAGRSPAPRRPARGAGPGDGADHGRRVEAGDDRRHPGPADRRRPRRASGACAARLAAARGGSGRRWGWRRSSRGRSARPWSRPRAWSRGGGAGRRPAGGGSAGGRVLLFLAVTAPWFVAVGLRRAASSSGSRSRPRSSSGSSRGWSSTAASRGITRSRPCRCSTRGRPCCPRRSARPGRGGGVARRSGFLLGWIVGPWLVLECFRTKLVHYYLPALPGLRDAGGLAGRRGGRGRRLARTWPLGRLAVGCSAGSGSAGASAGRPGRSCSPRPLRAPCLAMAWSWPSATAWPGSSSGRGGRAGRAGPGRRPGRW